jgi:hypothetical protein
MEVNWQTVAILLTISGFSSTAMVLAVRIINGRLIEEIQQLRKSIDAGSQRTQDIEKEILQLRAELARDYVRRDDWIRFGGSIESKLDSLRALIDRDRGAARERTHG